MSKRVTAGLMLLLVMGAFAFAGGMEPIDPSIVGEWRFTEATTPAGNLGPLPGQEYLMTLREDGTMTLNFEGNVVDGAFAADGTTVAISPDLSDSPSWLPGSPAARLVELLSQARAYSVDAGSLSLETLAGTGSLEFERVE